MQYAARYREKPSLASAAPAAHRALRRNFTLNAHLDDDAELYALGLTDPDASAAIEAHLAGCDACRARVVAAEAAAASLADALPTVPPAVTRPVRSAASLRARWAAPLATAAALAFATTAVVEGFAAHDASSQLGRTDVALTALAGSHFGHTTLTSDPGVVAKAIYARDGSWCYVVANGVGRGAHVVVRKDGNERDLGTLSGNAPATLFTRGAGRVDDVQIIENGRAVAHGTPVYGS